jgi:hypothetical protein
MEGATRKVSTLMEDEVTVVQEFAVDAVVTEQPTTDVEMDNDDVNGLEDFDDEVDVSATSDEQTTLLVSYETATMISLPAGSWLPSGRPWPTSSTRVWQRPPTVTLRWRRTSMRLSPPATTRRGTTTSRDGHRGSHDDKYI